MGVNWLRNNKDPRNFLSCLRDCGIGRFFKPSIFSVSGYNLPVSKSIIIPYSLTRPDAIKMHLLAFTLRPWSRNLVQTSLTAWKFCSGVSVSMRILSEYSWTWSIPARTYIKALSSKFLLANAPIGTRRKNIRPSQPVTWGEKPVRFWASFDNLKLWNAAHTSIIEIYFICVVILFSCWVVLCCTTGLLLQARFSASKCWTMRRFWAACLLGIPGIKSSFFPPCCKNSVSVSSLRAFGIKYVAASNIEYPRAIIFKSHNACNILLAAGTNSGCRKCLFMGIGVRFAPSLIGKSKSIILYRGYPDVNNPMSLLLFAHKGCTGNFVSFISSTNCLNLSRYISLLVMILTWSRGLSSTVSPVTLSLNWILFTVYFSLIPLLSPAMLSTPVKRFTRWSLITRFLKHLLIAAWLIIRAWKL